MRIGVSLRTYHAGTCAFSWSDEDGVDLARRFYGATKYKDTSGGCASGCATCGAPGASFMLVFSGF